MKELVENPGENTAGNLNMLYNLMPKARFLVLTNASLSQEEDQQTDLAHNREFISKLHFIRDGNRILLPLFTDMENLELYAKDCIGGRYLNILNSKDVFSIASYNRDRYDAIIINPSSEPKGMELDLNAICGILSHLINEDCTSQIVDLIRVSFSASNESIKPEDAVLAIGNLTGLFVFLEVASKGRIDWTTIEPGTALISPEADELGQQIYGKFMEGIVSYGISSEWLTPKESDYKPNLSYLDMIDDIQRPAMDIMESQHISYSEAAALCAKAGAFILCNLSSSKENDFEQQLGLYFYGLIQGSKTVPNHK